MCYLDKTSCRARECHDQGSFVGGIKGEQEEDGQLKERRSPENLPVWPKVKPGSSLDRMFFPELDPNTPGDPCCSQRSTLHQKPGQRLTGVTLLKPSTPPKERKQACIHGMIYPRSPN